jgi:predicted nucleotidyltransferase
MIFSALTINQSMLDEFCRRWNIQELALFGSALRDDFGPDSDIDLLITFTDDADWGLLAHLQIQHELESILGRSVDLISRQALAQSPNWLRRQAILDTAQVLYRRDEELHGA